MTRRKRLNLHDITKPKPMMDLTGVQGYDAIMDALRDDRPYDDLPAQPLSSIQPHIPDRFTFTHTVTDEELVSCADSDVLYRDITRTLRQRVTLYLERFYPNDATGDWTVRVDIIPRAMMQVTDVRITARRNRT